MAPKPTQLKDEAQQAGLVGRMDHADPAEPAAQTGGATRTDYAGRTDQSRRTDQSDRTDLSGQSGRAGEPVRADRSGSDPCSTPIDRKAPAGAPNSLGAKSDCNGRPTTDDSVVEAKDELDPAIPPPMPEPRSARR